jgi:hypothetical protein
MCRLLALVALVGSCKQVFDLEGFVPPPEERPRPEEPFADQVIGSTRAGTIVAATRDGYGFPDAETEFRLYLRGERFAEGTLETTDWQRAISHDEATNTYTFQLIVERCVVDDAGARCVRTLPD